MNRHFWLYLLLAVLILNGVVFSVGVYRGGVLFGPVGEVALASGLRTDLVQVERPWNEPAELASSQPVQSEPEPTPIDLQQGRADLSSALEKGEQKVKDEVPEPEQCFRWGPLLSDQVQRVADSLGDWSGRWVRSEEREPIGYIVYLPREQVEQGLGLSELTALGVQETFYMAQPGPLQGAISLGLFRDEVRARTHQEDMLRQGVLGVDVEARLGPARTFINLYGVQAQIDTLREIYALNRRSTLSPCPAQDVRVDGSDQTVESPPTDERPSAQSPGSTPSL